MAQMTQMAQPAGCFAAGRRALVLPSLMSAICAICG
jgi:hypothetical protein